MTILVPIAMFSWIPLVIVMFALLPQRQAVATAFLAAWMFLPEHTYEVSGLPDYTKMSATCVGILLSTVIFHWDRFRQIRWQWTDLPMVIWCLVPLGSSISNGLGVYDGVSTSLNTAVTWGFPYLVGRLHFNDLAGLRFLAKALFVGGLIYVPFCLWEVKMSTQLNERVYGFRAGPFRDVLRFGGYRPEVFMKSGLMVGMWMCTTAMIGAWLWWTRSVRTLGNWPVGWFALLLVVTAVLCKAMGAVGLLGLGLAVLYGTIRWRTRSLMYVLVTIPFLYCGVRSLGVWSGDELLSVAAMISQERADSLNFRLVNEDMLVNRAAEQPLLGWGGYGRNRVIDAETGADLTITDGLWVIVLGMHGLVGLGALLCVCALPAWLFMRRVSVSLWSHPEYAGAAALAVGLLLYSVDNLFNAMINPVFMLCAGGLISFYAGVRTRHNAVAVRSPSVHHHAIGLS